jgi:hypothetical protein
VATPAVGLGLQALVGDWEFVEEGQGSVVMRFSLEPDGQSFTLINNETGEKVGRRVGP